MEEERVLAAQIRGMADADKNIAAIEGDPTTVVTGKDIKTTQHALLRSAWHVQPVVKTGI
jgi:hypothetical protein